MIVDSALYRKGQRVEVDCFPHEFDKLRGEAVNAGVRIAQTVIGALFRRR